MKGRFALVAVPRRFVKDWMLNFANFAVGNTFLTRRPLRWIFFRDLSARDQMERGE